MDNVVALDGKAVVEKSDRDEFIEYATACYDNYVRTNIQNPEGFVMTMGGVQQALSVSWMTKHLTSQCPNAFLARTVLAIQGKANSYG